MPARSRANLGPARPKPGPSTSTRREPGVAGLGRLRGSTAATRVGRSPKDRRDRHRESLALWRPEPGRPIARARDDGHRWSSASSRVRDAGRRCPAGWPNNRSANRSLARVRPAGWRPAKTGQRRRRIRRQSNRKLFVSCRIPRQRLKEVSPANRLGEVVDLVAMFPLGPHVFDAEVAAIAGGLHHSDDPPIVDRVIVE